MRVISGGCLGVWASRMMELTSYGKERRKEEDVGDCKEGKMERRRQGRIAGNLREGQSS